MKPGKDVFHFATIFYFKFVFKFLLNRLTSNNIIACHIPLPAHGGNFDTCIYTGKSVFFSDLFYP